MDDEQEKLMIDLMAGDIEPATAYVVAESPDKGEDKPSGCAAAVLLVVAVILYWLL